MDEILSAESIDLEELKQKTFFGCPDNGSTRALVWRLILSALPVNKAEWEKTLESQRVNYSTFVKEFIIRPDEEKNSASNDPLSNTGNTWDEYFKDNDLLSQIEKDARRLYPDISFFSEPAKYPAVDFIHESYKTGMLKMRISKRNVTSSQSAKSRNGTILMTESTNGDEDDDQECKVEKNWEVVERLLFVYAKLNQGTKYIQGMNEIIGPIYFVLSQDPDLEWSRNAEADTFYCFTQVMSEIRDNFIQSMDESTSGIHALMAQTFTLLKKHDYSVWQVLNDQEIRPQFFLFRWMTLLLSQEMRIPDTIRLWDSLFSDSRRFEFLKYVCVAILTLIREDLISGDFGFNMKLLQNTSDVLPDVLIIIRKADELRQKDLRKNSGPHIQLLSKAQLAHSNFSR
ncbi:unnamed protein product [Oikopleura dioica]|uniref:Rab-GAP TBC domain-containing protein n=1 Tax=Oikopleura dioica TaxID=34765 RepID=E4X5Q4_OIKDI|nr:unnamed protein product [Oikopleura dioica]